MNTDETVTVFITSPQDEAEHIARKLVEAKLVACVNIIPSVNSFYWWEGKIESDQESLLIIKTTRAAVDQMLPVVKEVHPYENFELIALKIEAGSRPYLDWIRESVNG